VPGKLRERVFDAEALSGGSGELALELEVDAKSAPPVSRPVPSGPVSARPVSVGSAVPVDRGPISHAPKIDALDIRLVAKFGPAPESIWEAPGYARRVRARVKELHQLVTPRIARKVRTKTELEDALVALAQRGVAATRLMTRAARAPYQQTLERITQREAALRSVDSAAMGQMEAHNAEVEAIAKRIEEIQNEVLAAKAEERKMLESSSEQQLKEPERTRLLESAEKKIEEGQGALEVAREERNALEAAFKQKADAPNPAAEKARKEFRATCADFAQFVIDDPSNFGEEFNGARENIARLRKAAETAERDCDLHEAALSAYDAEAVSRGDTLLYGGIGAAALVLAIVIFLAVR
jgi:hypothetical protein